MRITNETDRGFWGDLWNDVKDVARADFDGAVAGAPGGPLMSAAIGGGASGSEAAGKILGRSVNPSTFDPVFTSNPFDIVGKVHVEFLSRSVDDLLEVEGAEWVDVFDGTTFNYEAYLEYTENYVLENDLFSAEELESLTLENLTDETTLALEYADVLMPDAILEFNGMGYLNAEETDILHSYFESFEASTDYESFYDYTIAAETVVIESEMTEPSKEIILSVMATVRHDLNYWNGLE